MKLRLSFFVSTSKHDKKLEDNFDKTRTIFYRMQSSWYRFFNILILSCKESFHGFFVIFKCFIFDQLCVKLHRLCTYNFKVHLSLCENAILILFSKLIFPISQLKTEWTRSRFEQFSCSSSNWSCRNELSTRRSILGTALTNGGLKNFEGLEDDERGNASRPGEKRR